MAASVPGLGAIQPGDLTELRQLIELPTVRKLANRGLTDQELALATKLADATMRPARSGDVPGYLRADMTFHLCLMELAGDPALSEIARLLLGPTLTREPCGGDLMVREAREHRELIDMLAGDLVSAADDLLRIHLGRQAGGGAGVGNDR